MAIATTFLLYNLVYHLAARKTVSSIGVGGQRAPHSTESGLTDEQDRSSVGGRRSVSIIPITEEAELQPRAPIKFANSLPKREAKAAK